MTNNPTATGMKASFIAMGAPAPNKREPAEPRSSTESRGTAEQSVAIGMKAPLLAAGSPMLVRKSTSELRGTAEQAIDEANDGDASEAMQSPFSGPFVFDRKIIRLLKLAGKSSRNPQDDQKRDSDKEE